MWRLRSTGWPSIPQAHWGAQLTLDFQRLKPEEHAFPASTCRATLNYHPAAPRLLHLSTLPFPIPQSLNLSAFFRVAAADLNVLGQNQPTDGTLWAAPIIPKGDPFAEERTPVELGVTPVWGGDRLGLQARERFPSPRAWRRSV